MVFHACTLCLVEGFRFEVAGSIAARALSLGAGRAAHPLIARVATAAIADGQ